MRAKALPIFAVAALGFGIPYVAAYCTRLAHGVFHTPSAKVSLLEWLYIQHAFPLAIALVLIGICKRAFPADYGLHFPRNRTYVGAAIGWGILFGLLMTIVDYAPWLMSGTKPNVGFRSPRRTSSVGYSSKGSMSA